MQIDKSQIIELLKTRGEQDKADQADAELPEKVDTEQHQGLLEKLGISPTELLSKFSGGLNF